MNVDRAALEEKVWKRVPADWKVRASDGTKTVLFRDATGRRLRPMTTLTNADLFKVWRLAVMPIPEA